MERDRQLAGAEVGAEVAADLADRVDDQLADLLGELLELVGREVREVAGALDVHQQALGVLADGLDGSCSVLFAHVSRVWMKSVILREVVGLGVGLGERLARVRVRLRGQLACPVEAECAHVGQLAVPFVASTRLAELFVASGDVEDVIDDLEEDAELIGEPSIRHCRSFGNVT